jgi:hypothetical protein
MSKLLDNLVSNDKRFDDKLRWQKDGNQYFLYLAEGYVWYGTSTVLGSSVKDVLRNTKDIEKGEWN